MTSQFSDRLNMLECFFFYANENWTKDYVMNQIRVNIGKQIEHTERT
jgi:hypothetical protein